MIPLPEYLTSTMQVGNLALMLCLLILCTQVGSCGHAYFFQACRGLLGRFGGGWGMLIPMNQFAKMPGQNLEESFEVKVR